MFIGDELKKIRKEKGMTQEQLASALGVSVMTIRRYEANTSEPKNDTFFAICEVLGLKPEQFFYNHVRDCLLSDNAFDYDPEIRPLTNQPSIRSSHTRARVLSAFELLNPDGQEIAAQRIEELTEIERYTRPKTDHETPED